MSRFTALKMADEVATHPNISKKDYLFGLLHNVVYRPTSSEVESYSNYYSEEDAKLIKLLIESKKEQLEENIRQLESVNETPGASFRLDLCVSHDSNFIAMQLNHVTNNTTTHITPIRYFEGTEAMSVDKIF